MVILERYYQVLNYSGLRHYRVLPSRLGNCLSNYLLRRRGRGEGDPVCAAEEPGGRGKHERGVVVGGQIVGSSVVSFHVRGEERQTVTAPTPPLQANGRTRLN